MKKNQTQDDNILEPDWVEEQEVNIESDADEAKVIDIQGDSAEGGSEKEKGESEQDPKSELEQLRSSLAESQDQYIRLQAEFQNFRKRKERELGEAIRFANGDLLLKLLPILDNFSRTLEAIEKTDNLAAIKEGIELVSQSMQKQFEKVGLTEIKSVGQDFNVELHEAITAVPVEEEAKKGKVIDEVEKGYRLKDKVLRFSKVIVGE